MKRILLLSAVFAAGLTGALAADLQVTVDTIGKKGTLYFALFDQEGFFKKPIATVKSEPSHPNAVFQNLAPGRYAVSVFQDLNDNGVLDRNLAGAPIEPYGFSNDAIGNMGPPRFDAAAMQIGTENPSVAIKLR